ncbi:AAA family ATPase [Acinetobacter soli]|uniref:AAA family ATPase n=1 Tax=Acinetobacter soli TaxID=487316 RepID=UPI003A843A25
MLLQKVTLLNFRCYERLEINFKERTTVLVAINGQGKTTILDSIRIALWPYVSQFDLAKTAFADSANTITIDDIRIIKKVDGDQLEMARQLPSSVSATCSFNDRVFCWARIRDSEAKLSRAKDDSGTKKLKDYAKKIQERIRNLDQKSTLDLPVFGYYGTGRLWKEKRLTESKKNTRDEVNAKIRTFAYQDCLDPASSFKQFEDWFIAEYKHDFAKKIIALEKGVTTFPAANVTILAVKGAVDIILETVGWKNLAYSQQYGSLILEHEDYGVMKMSQLSDGIKNMIGMIADIAYRCVLLNGHLGKDAARLSTGLVMIDEIDMHLHPQWQQDVISSLEIAFENIQFIVTTHSPQVLTTVNSTSICILEDGHMYGAPVGSQGAESARLLKRIFGVDTRPESLKITKELRTYERMVYDDKWNEQEALELRKQLNEAFGNEEPLLTQLDLYIDNRRWELGIEEN